MTAFLWVESGTWLHLRESFVPWTYTQTACMSTSVYDLVDCMSSSSFMHALIIKKCKNYVKHALVQHRACHLFTGRVLQPYTYNRTWLHLQDCLARHGFIYYTTPLLHDQAVARPTKGKCHSLTTNYKSIASAFPGLQCPQLLPVVCFEGPFGFSWRQKFMISSFTFPSIHSSG